MFRNLRLYRLHSEWPQQEDDLSQKLYNVEFKPCGAYAERSMGWEAPAGETSPALCRRVAGADLFRLRTQSRLLPTSAINEAMEGRIEEFRQRTQRDPSRKEKRDLKDEIEAELRPRALLKSDRTWGFYLQSEQLIGIDTTSEPAAERFLDQLRSSLGSLQVTPLAFKEPVSKLLQQIFLGGGPTAFHAGEECRMVDPSAGTASVNWFGIDLGDPSIQKHVKDGLKIDRLGVEFDGVMSCVIGQDSVIRKLKFGGTDVMEDEVDEDPLANLDAEFVLITGMVKRLVTRLKKVLGGYD
jgi:recombination associated protein RdgC